MRRCPSARWTRSSASWWSRCASAFPNWSPVPATCSDRAPGRAQKRRLTLPAYEAILGLEPSASRHLHMQLRDALFSSESVTEGHPDKVCDQISDAVLDECLRQDRTSRVALETAVKTGLVVLVGEITTRCTLDYPRIVRRTVERIGYTDGSMGFDAKSCAVLVAVEQQSPEIAMGVDAGANKEQGAGDQGMMFGYACDETPELMPLPIALAHRLTRRLSECRRSGMPFLRPDGKSQVSVEYRNGRPYKVHAVVIAAQHEDSVSTEHLRQSVNSEVIDKVVPPELRAPDMKRWVNATGRFVIGGPQGDSGVTGRKIIVDTYGGMGHHGGGAFSRKPATIIKDLDLLRPIYEKTAAYGHFGRSEPEFTWERTDRAESLRSAAGLKGKATSAA